MLLERVGYEGRAVSNGGHLVRLENNGTEEGVGRAFRVGNSE